MKTPFLLLLASILVLFGLGLSSCAEAPAAWQDTPNPLDFPAGPVARPLESQGTFGPHTEYY